MAIDKKGIVYWITGLSGAGKTTVGMKLFDYLKNRNDNVIRLDGDILREVFKNTDYTYKGRKMLAFQYSRLCKMISEQGIDVVICTISMYDEVRSWNRENIDHYEEIFLDVSMDELMRRDQKGIYSRAKSHKEKNVSGVNMHTEMPQNPDLIIRNYGEIDPNKALQMILNKYGL